MHSRLHLISVNSLRRRTYSLTFEPYDSAQRLFYQPADHIGLCPSNRKELVDGIIACIVDAPPENQILKIESVDANDVEANDNNGKVFS